MQENIQTLQDFIDKLQQTPFQLSNDYFHSVLSELNSKIDNGTTLDHLKGKLTGTYYECVSRQPGLSPLLTCLYSTLIESDNAGAIIAGNGLLNAVTRQSETVSPEYFEAFETTHGVVISNCVINPEEQ